MQPILDGQSVDPAVIDPAKHRYVGMWRPVEPPTNNYCPCGASFLYANDDVFAAHWRRGHFDVPQYESRERVPACTAVEARKAWDEMQRRYYAGEFDKKPARLRIPASEVKAGDVVIHASGYRTSPVKEVKVERSYFFEGDDGWSRIDDELVEVERVNG